MGLLGNAVDLAKLAETGTYGGVDKLDRRVRKHKEKLVDHHARDADKRRYV